MSEVTLLALDWGTSSLRAFVLGRDGAVLEEHVRPWGILHLPEAGFDAALHGVLGPWMGQGLPIIASGMVGSAQGWHEAAYVRCPADARSLSRALLSFRAAGGDAVHIVPGLLREGPRPDVMRGEETQIVGALQGACALPADCTVILPGTHSKWVRLRESCIVDFDTWMTGELFAVLRDHSILGRSARQATAPESSDAAAFERGVRQVRDGGECSVTQLLFSARALVLTQRLDAADSLEYLSGLLIGDEVRGALAARPRCDASRLALIGEAALCDRYRRALAQWGLDDVQALQGASVRGLWRIARAAGLVAGE